MPPMPPSRVAGGVPSGALPDEKKSLKYAFAWSNVASADVYFAMVASRPTEVLLVTLTQPWAGSPDDGTVMPESSIDPCVTPSVGGVALDFPDTLNTLYMPCAACGLPSEAAGTKHTIPYVPAVNFVIVVVDAFGLSSDGVPYTVGSPGA